jgi:UrcA family protein
MDTYISPLILSSALAGALLGAAPYVAAQEAQPSRNLGPSLTVRFADLNPSSSQGVQAIYERIASAAKVVCGPRSSAVDLRRSWDFEVCYRMTMDHTVRQIGMPNLTALHESRTHGSMAQAKLPGGEPARSEVAANNKVKE